MASESAQLFATIKLARGSTRRCFELDVELEVPPGFTILFGPSCAGKSTLLDAISGLLRPQFARITLAGSILHDSAAKIFVAPQKRQIAYLFQSPALFPHLNVRKNAEFGL